MASASKPFPQTKHPRSDIISAPNGVTSLAVPSAPLSPDEYKTYALQDPGFLGLKSSLQGNEDAYRAQARGAINKGVINLGIAPPDASLAPWLDAGTADAAGANTLSTAHQLGVQHAQNLRSLQNNLAARGGYDSGELTYGLGNENARDNQARSDAMGRFLDYANGLFGNLGSMQASDASQLGNELGNAAMRQLALHPGTTTSAVWDDSRGAYIDASGNAYDQYGNHITTAGGPPTTSFGDWSPQGLGVTGTGIFAPDAGPVTPDQSAQLIAAGAIPDTPASTQPITTHYGSIGIGTRNI